LLNQVKQVWMYYQQWISMQAQPDPSAMQPQGSQPGQQQSAPGGTPNGSAPGGNSVSAQADEQVKQADKTGNNLAKGAAHEN
jgi:hypothetical protein